MDHHTLYPLYSRMLPPQDAVKLRSHLLGEPVHGLPAMIGAGGPHSGWATFQAAYCDECVRDDIAPTGVPFWRTEHLVPGGLVCAKHAKPLFVPCRMCTPDNWAALVPLPGRRCDCPAIPLVSEEALSEASFAFEIEVARAAGKLLNNNYLPQLDAKAIGSLVRLGAHRIGIPRQEEARHKAWVAFINEPRLRESFERMSFHTISFQRVALVLRGRMVLRHPLRTIALLIGLWGSWDAVERAANGARWPASPTMRRYGKPPTASGSQPGHRHKKGQRDIDAATLLATYKRLRHEQPGSHRAGLLLQLPDGARDVLPRAVLDAADIEVLGDIPELDRSLAEHFYVRLETLVAMGHPARISAKQLLEGHPMGPAWFRIRTLLPRAVQALRLCAEAKNHHLARMRVLPYLIEPAAPAASI
ncbi:hypothetical protein ACNRBS_02710 [Ralstonia pseudosolanacearum]|uniref:hypothetical protein n=1 Tax=Ralstonia pseudosolanacearum TaxID=1310165 RepID=UPI003AABBABC